MPEEKMSSKSTAPSSLLLQKLGYTLLKCICKNTAYQWTKQNATDKWRRSFKDSLEMSSSQRSMLTPMPPPPRKSQTYTKAFLTADVHLYQGHTWELMKGRKALLLPHPTPICCCFKNIRDISSKGSRPAAPVLRSLHSQSQDYHLSVSFGET